MEHENNTLPNFIDGQAENTIKAAYINISTGIVENIIILKSLEDTISQGYKAVEVPYEYEELDLEMYKLIQTIDPDYAMPEKKKIQRPVHIGITKWDELNGFYEE